MHYATGRPSPLPDAKIFAAVTAAIEHNLTGVTAENYETAMPAADQNQYSGGGVVGAGTVSVYERYLSSPLTLNTLILIDAIFRKFANDREVGVPQKVPIPNPSKGCYLSARLESFVQPFRTNWAGDEMGHISRSIISKTSARFSVLPSPHQSKATSSE